MELFGNTELLEEFQRRVRESEESLLLLDYDGTLAPFAVDRMKAVPSPGIRECLDDIIAAGRTRVVFISGRIADELAQLAGLSHDVEIWGCHGREHRLPDGSIEVVGLTGEHLKALARGLDDVADVVPTWRIEQKTGSVAVHWRGMDAESRAALVNDVRALWEPVAARSGLVVKAFDGGLELLAPGRTKGDVIRELLHEADPEQTPVAFLGDDLTDEDGFEVLKGRGLCVLVRNEERESAADIRITQPDGLMFFLRGWLDHVDAREGTG